MLCVKSSVSIDSFNNFKLPYAKIDDEFANKPHYINCIQNIL